MKKLVAVCMAFVLALGVVSSGFAADFKPMTWKFACSAGETSTWVAGAKKFAEIVGEKTGGAVTVEFYPSDQLTAGSQTDGIQALMDGTTEISMHSNMIWCAFDERLSIVCLPFLFDNVEEVDAVLEGPAGDALRKILEEGYNVHLMGIAENGFRHPTNSKRPIKTMADMKDLKMRVAGSQLLNRAYQLWGADYANANWGEVFTALQTGTYDGQENPIPTADSASIQEVQKFCTYWTGTYDCLFFSMNKDLYDSLSPELKAIVDEAGIEACRFQRKLNRDEDAVALKRWTDAGVQIDYLTPEAAEEFRKTAAPVYKEFEAKLTPELMKVFLDSVAAVRNK